MRIALLSYRSKTHCGGQGVYIRHLSRGLVELGHQVEVFSGQPYPEVLDPRVRLTEVPSLDLYREPDPFRVPHPREIRDRIDVLELATMWTGGFPEPRTFSLRAARLLAQRSAEFDVVHDNQCLGTGLLKIARHLPVVATVHHPITRDRVLDLDAATWWRGPSVHRWYGFTAMQKKVARRIPDLLTVSSSSAVDIADDFGVHPDQLHVVPLGVDTERFKPADAPRVAGRIIAISSADRPLKGIGHLLQAVARLRAGHDVELQLVAKLEPNGPTEKLIAELGISDIALCGLAKRLEEVWLPDNADPLIFPRNSEGLYLLQRIRDEAHRFAITFHRSRRSKVMLESLLDEIPGLGSARRAALLDRFGSVSAIRKAEIAELASTPGIGEKLALTIAESLARIGKGEQVNMTTGEITGA